MAEIDELHDAFGRRLNYVRISVTDRCNFRCRYCMPPEGVKCLSHSDILRYEDIKFLCGVLSEMGVGKFRFTGGEPLVRKGLVPFLKDLRNEMPSVKITLTTNASLLDEYASGLAESGIDSLNISLDTLDPAKFAEVTRIGSLEKVLSGIEAARSAGIENIKLNAVLVRGFNDKEIPEMLSYARKNALLLRLIEFMPLQESVWKKDSFISGEEILASLPCGEAWEKIEAIGNDDGPAQYYFNRESGDKIGIITAVSNHFCQKCNRLRISAEGKLRTCLFSNEETALKSIIQERDESALKAEIIRSAGNKPRRWKDINKGNLQMSGIGG